MKKFALLGVALAVFVGGALAQQGGQAPGPARDQGWLKQLVGEWDVRFKIYMEPGQPPEESTGTDSVRALGEHWVIAETTTTMMGAPYRGMLSLGYDAQKGRFHGTWIDSFGGYMWVYTGSLNEAGDTLTLETVGPSVLSPDKTARYREEIRITGENSRTFTSNYEGEDGEWVRLVSIEFSRKK